MKKLYYSVSLILFSTAVSIAQNPENEDQVFHKELPTKFFKSVPIRDILEQLPVFDESSWDNAEQKKRHLDRYQELPGLNDWGIPETGGIDPALQTVPATRKENWIRAQWSGQNGGFPPDPSGAAGIDYYVQAVNSTYRIWDKEGNAESSPLSVSSLVGGGDSDPIVMYDRYADRWLVGQMGITSEDIYLAISETADPLGAYYVYQYSYSDLPDYPKFSIWSHSYFMTANVGSQDCSAFEREKMLLGDPDAGVIKMNFPTYIQYFNSAGTAYAEGPTAPDMDEPGYFFAVQEDAWDGSIPNDAIKILKATIDWTAGTGNVNSHQLLNTNPFNCVFTMTWDDIEQDHTQKLDAVTGIFMYKAQYRRFDGYNAVVLCQTVDMGSNRAGIRWYELRDADDGNWYIHQQATWSPTTTHSRWMGSIAMDGQGNIALAYSFCGPNDDPGLRYTARYASDPLNQMTVEEQIAVEGTGPQTGGNRWGDYSQMTIDPTDDMTFWFTGEWHAASKKTEIFSFSSWHLLENGETEKPAFPTVNAYQPNPNEVTVMWNDLKDENATMTLYDMNGKAMIVEQITGSTNKVSFEIPGNATGIYVIKVSGKNTDLSEKIYLAK